MCLCVCVHVLVRMEVWVCGFWGARAGAEVAAGGEASTLAHSGTGAGVGRRAEAEHIEVG